MDELHAIVIPCYNEAVRFVSEDYIVFLNNNSAVKLCIVDDGSTDTTKSVLQKLQLDFPSQIEILSLPTNVGKGNAIRQGMEFSLSKFPNCSDFGFLDSDLSVDLNTYKKMLDIHRADNNIMTYASREKIRTTEIKNTAIRKIASVVAKIMVRWCFNLSINDTQCGAKIVNRKVAIKIFQIPFNSRWLFDIEMFMRLKNLSGLERVSPYYLKSWMYRANSKLNNADLLFYIPRDLLGMFIEYRLK